MRNTVQIWYSLLLSLIYLWGEKETDLVVNVSLAPKNLKIYDVPNCLFSTI